MPSVDISKTAFSSVRNLELPAPAEQMRLGSQFLDWTAGNPYTFDLQYARYEGVGFIPQAMELDNSANPASVTVTVSNQLSWARTVRPFERRTFMVPAVPNLQFSVAASTGGPAPTSTQLYMYNWPAFPDSESEAGSEQFAADNVDGIAPIATPAFLETISRLMGLDAAGNWDRIRTVSDANLAFPPQIMGLLGAVVRNQVMVSGDWTPLQGLSFTDAQNLRANQTGLYVSSMSVFPDGNAALKSVRYANLFATAQVSAAGSTALFTAPAGDYWRLLGYSLEVTDDATLAVAGEVIVSFLDVAAGIGISHALALPAAAVAGVGSHPVMPLSMGNGYRSAATGTALNVNLSTALATGVLNVNVALLVGTDP